MKISIKDILIATGIAITTILLTAGLVEATTVLQPTGGGTGTSTPPVYGQVLVGNPGGTYTLTATSSLGISSGGSGTVTSVGTNNGLTGGTITTTGTLGLDTSGFSVNAPITWNGSKLIATGTPQLTVGNIVATSTTASSSINILGIGTSSPFSPLTISMNSASIVPINIRPATGITPNADFLDLYLTSSRSSVAPDISVSSVGAITIPNNTNGAGFCMGGSTGSCMGISSAGAFAFPNVNGGSYINISNTNVISGNGSGLTTLNATNLSSGTVGTGRLGSGTANATAYLQGNSTWQQLQWVTSGTNILSNLGGSVGISTTTPWGKLSVGTVNLSQTTPSFVIASSSTGIATTTQFIITNGNAGVGTSTPYAPLSIQANSSTGDAFVVATSSGATVAGVDNDGHSFTSGPAGVVSSCGTGSGTVVGDDQSGTITTATAATSCTYTFAKVYQKTPTCTVTDDSLVGFADISSISTSAVTFGISSALTGGNLYYRCGYHR